MYIKLNLEAGLDLCCSKFSLILNLLPNIIVICKINVIIVISVINIAIMVSDIKKISMINKIGNISMIRIWLHWSATSTSMIRTIRMISLNLLWAPLTAQYPSKQVKKSAFL